MKNKLFDICQKNDISLSSEQLEQFETFYDYMLEMNQVMNLTSITDEDEVVLKHFFDSMSLINYYEVKNGSRVIDVGTGAGFPGIPLAILLPNVHFTLMDSLNKRILFLNILIHRIAHRSLKPTTFLTPLGIDWLIELLINTSFVPTSLHCQLLMFELVCHFASLQALSIPPECWRMHLRFPYILRITLGLLSLEVLHLEL